jgi:hypothetical protein
MARRQARTSRHPHDPGRSFVWVVGVNPPWRCDRMQNRRPTASPHSDLTGTVGVDAGRSHEDDLRPVGMNHQPSQRPACGAQPTAPRCASATEVYRSELARVPRGRAVPRPRRGAA